MNERMEIPFGKRVFHVGVIYSDNKQLSITVQPDLSVTAKAPAHYTRDIIKNKLQKKASWIAKQVDFFDQYHPRQPARKYVSGETHYYLGRQYRLKIQTSQVNRVRLIGRYFIVETTDPVNADTVKFLMQKWYTIHSKALLTKRTVIYWPYFERLGAKTLGLQFRRMQKRWGSCSSSGKIVLNTELVKAPLHSIDYVIVHELCHLIAPKHDNKFYRLLGRIMPDWEKRKDRLERIVI